MNTTALRRVLGRAGVAKKGAENTYRLAGGDNAAEGLLGCIKTTLRRMGGQALVRQRTPLCKSHVIFCVNYSI